MHTACQQAEIKRCCCYHFMRRQFDVMNVKAFLLLLRHIKEGPVKHLLDWDLSVQFQLLEDHGTLAAVQLQHCAEL